MVLISFALCDERTFNLNSGNKVTGEIINIDDNGNYTVITTMGEVVFNQNEIVLENVKITTNNGDRVIGVLQNEDNETVAYSNAYEYLLYNKILTNTQRKKIFKNVTLDDIKKVAKEIFDYNRLNYVVISNQKYKQFIKKI